MSSDNKNKIEKMLLELRKYPSYADTGAGIKEDDVALVNSARIIEIAQEIISLIANDRRFYDEKEESYWRLSHALVYRSRAFFEKSILWSDTTFLRDISKQKLLENFKNRGSNKNNVREAIKNLNHLLSDELREYMPFADLYLLLRCNCYRVLGDYEKAIEDAVNIVEFSRSRQDGHSLLLACYLDNMDYDDAVRSAEKRYQEILKTHERQ